MSGDASDISSYAACCGGPQAPVERHPETGRTAREEQLVGWRYYLGWAIVESQMIGNVARREVAAEAGYRNVTEVLREIDAHLADLIHEEEQRG